MVDIGNVDAEDYVYNLKEIMTRYDRLVSGKKIDELRTRIENGETLTVMENEDSIPVKVSLEEMVVQDIRIHGVNHPYERFETLYTGERIVRCRNCKHTWVGIEYDPDNDTFSRILYCSHPNAEVMESMPVDASDFCSWGERRSDA